MLASMMCSTSASSSPSSAHLQLRRRHCLRFSMGAPYFCLNAFCAPGCSAAPGTSWCSGLVCHRLKQLGSQWTASVWLTLRSSSRTSCFQRKGVMLWSVRPIIVGSSVANLARGQVCVYRVGLEEELESKLS